MCRWLHDCPCRPRRRWPRSWRQPAGYVVRTSLESTLNNAPGSIKVFWGRQEAGQVPAIASVLYQDLVKFFRHFCIYDEAERFFSAFLPHDPEIAAHILQTYDRHPQLDAQLDRLLAVSARALLRCPPTHVSNLFVEQSRLLLAQVLPPNKSKKKEEEEEEEEV